MYKEVYDVYNVIYLLHLKKMKEYLIFSPHFEGDLLLDITLEDLDDTSASRYTNMN